MKKQSKGMPLAWGMDRIEYVIMTDAQGEKWAVPKTVNGTPVDHLRKYDPNFFSKEHTFERITIK